MKNSYCVGVLTAFVFLNATRTEQQCRQRANYVDINLIDLSSLTANVNAILTEFILGFRKQQKLNLRQIVFEKVTNRSTIFDGKSLGIEPSSLLDYATSKAGCLTGLSHLSVSIEEHREDTNSESLVLVLNKVVKNWRNYGDNGYNVVDACVAQTRFRITFKNEGKSVVFLSFRQFLKKGCDTGHNHT